MSSTATFAPTTQTQTAQTANTSTTTRRPRDPNPPPGYAPGHPYVRTRSNPSPLNTMGELKNVPDDAKPVSPISEHMEEEEPKGKERAGPEDDMPGTALTQAERELLASTAENQRLREEANRGRAAMDELRRQLREAHGREYDLQHPVGGSAGGGGHGNGPPGGGPGPGGPPP